MGAWEQYQNTTNKVGPCALYKDDCPAEHYIPIYLIVSGAFSTILALLKVLANWCASGDGDRKIPVLEGISGIISLFLLAWFITGNVWIYGLYNKYSTEPSDPNFCNHTFYLYAFWVTTVTYILLGFISLLCCAACLCCRG